MAKGSQLSQLKTALSKAGVTGSQQHGKKKRPSGAQEKDKAKRAAKLDEIHRRLNPFDVKVTKLKHDVGGRKVKGVTGKPAQSRQAGIEQRKKTLLKEYEEKGRAGGILDRRFGENDPSMSLEERMLERFTRERQRSSRGVAFNLEDDADELTHYGQSLSKFDDFDGAGLQLAEEDDEEEEGGRGQMDGDVVRKTHFQGFSDDEEDDEPDRVKSKAEVMAEVIAKSKAHKQQHQMEREEEENVRHELDQQFSVLRSLLYSAPKPSVPEETDATADAPAPKATLMDIDIVPQHADYDQRVRELAFDARAKPKDRMKTEEEVARAAKEELEKAERARRKRMLGLEESDGEEEEGGRSKKRRRKEGGGGDDLEDDFALDGDEAWDGIGAGLPEANVDIDAEESGSEEDDGEGDDDEDEDDEEEGEHEELTSGSKPSKGKSRAPDKKELPFTFPCPSTHNELLEILGDVEDKDVPTVIQRIRSLFHTSLAPENKFKLQTLASVLIDHILYVSSPPEPNFTLVSALLPHLFVLTRAYPVPAAEHFVAKLSLMHKNLRRGLSRGALDPTSKTWPGLPELTLLRIIGAAWPTSDLNHAVVSPTRVLISAYLGLSRVRSVSDIASGLFLCSLVLQYEALSKRFVPEAVNFAINSVLHLAPHGYNAVEDLPGSFPAPDFRTDLALDSKKLTKELPKADLAVLLLGAENAEAKAQLLLLAVDILGRFAEMYKPLDGFVELYEPILEILLRVRDLHYSRIATVTDALTRLLKFANAGRRPLLLQAHKPIPIPSYVPKFEMSKSSYLRNQDPDKERNEAAKLRAQYKQERKGAIRELRKDARFLAGVEQEKQREKDRAYGERMHKVVGEIQTERAEEKAMEREKAKDKKRAGRK
ncbi:nucleolar protein 14 [Mycena amicta]|nr:nucleolar protein 14 [Mycena amicta]